MIGNVLCNAKKSPIGSANIVNTNINPSISICKLNNARSRIENDVPTPVNVDQLDAREFMFTLFQTANVLIGPVLIVVAHSGAATGGT